MHLNSLCKEGPPPSPQYPPGQRPRPTQAAPSMFRPLHYEAGRLASGRLVFLLECFLVRMMILPLSNFSLGKPLGFTHRCPLLCSNYKVRLSLHLLRFRKVKLYICDLRRVRNTGVCSFCRNFAKLCGAPSFRENVFDSSFSLLR